MGSFPEQQQVVWGKGFEVLGILRAICNRSTIHNCFDFAHKSVQALVVEHLLLGDCIQNLSYRTNTAFPNTSVVRCFGSVENPLHISLHEKLLDLLLMPRADRLPHLSISANEIYSVIGPYLFRLPSPCHKPQHVNERIGVQIVCNFYVDRSSSQTSKQNNRTVSHDFYRVSPQRVQNNLLLRK